MNNVQIDTQTSDKHVPLSRRIVGLVLRYGTVFLFVLLCLIVSRISPLFLTPSNLIKVVIQTAAIGIVAVGITFVLIIHDIDISVGAILALASLLAVRAMTLSHLPWYVGFLIFFLVAILAGAVNGFAVAKLGMDSFLVTLATQTILRGMVVAISGGKSWFGVPGILEFIGSGKLGPIPVPILVMLLAFLIGHIILSKTVFGRRVYAVGGNPEAARMQGIDVPRIRLLTFVLCAVFAGLASLVLTGRYNAFTPLMGLSFELSAIASAVIGGTSLLGGEGSLGGTLIGVLITGVINNALNLMGVSVFYQDVARGAIIFAAVLLDSLRKQLSEMQNR